MIQNSTTSIEFQKSSKQNRELMILFFSIILGVVIGYFFPNFMSSINWIGRIFMNYLMLLVLPLIFLALVSAICSIGDKNKIGNLSFVTVLVIFCNVLIASFIGLLFSLVLKPGHGIDPSLLLGNSGDHLLNKSTGITFSNFITSIFPANLGKAAVDSEILPLVFFSVFFSIIALRNKEKQTVQTLLNSLLGLKDIMMSMIAVVMKLTPLAMFALIGNAISSSLLNGHFASDMQGILEFILVFLLGCFVLCVFQFVVLLIFMKKEAFNFFRESLSCSFTGFATSSSMATLPVMLVSARDVGIEDTLGKFALPLTVVFNLGSSALYVASATIFVSQVLHVDMSFWNVCVIYFSTVLMGLGTTGIPNAGFIATMTVLKTIALPTNAVAILFPVDAILSRVRTAVNVWGHLFCTQCIQLILQKKKEKI